MNRIGEIKAWQGSKTLWSHIRRNPMDADAIAYLLSIVQKMRATSDGKYVGDGDVVWDYDRYHVFPRTVRVEAWETDDDGEYVCAFGDIEDTFSTKAKAAAALAAAEEGGGDE